MGIEGPDQHPNWVGLVARIRASDEKTVLQSEDVFQGRIRSAKTDGMEELYQLFSRGIRFYLCRQLGPQDLDDRVHDTFLIVVQAIRRGELREPERLMGFVRTIVRRQVAAQIDRVVHKRRDQAEFDSTARVPDPLRNPEEAAIFRQRVELIRQVLGELSERDREILTRFYIDEQSQDQICSDMDLTETQFRLLKSRAKARFGKLGKEALVHKGLHRAFLKLRGAHRRSQSGPRLAEPR